MITVLNTMNGKHSINIGTNNKGTNLYTPYRQNQFDNAFWEIDGIKYLILGPATHIAKSDTRELHDASLVIHAKLKNRKPSVPM